jgi:hypothetical protein
MATLKDELTYLRAELEMITSVIYNCMKDPDGTYETNNYFAASCGVTGCGSCRAGTRR